VSAPALDYDAEVFSASLSVPMVGGFTASLTQHWRLLDETQTGESLPRQLTASLSHFSSFGRGRWQLRGRFGYEDEEESGAVRSFLSGQDRLIWEAGIRHRPGPSTDLFADGRIEQIRFQGSGQERVEFSVLTGARLLLDTRVVRWDPSGPVGGVVFHDRNGDGQRQEPEEGLRGVKLVAGSVREAVTDAQGRFRFGRLWGKTVPISLDVSTLPAGYVVSTPQTRLIDPGVRRDRTVVFGALGRAEVRGRVFDDLDGDGRYSAGERGIAGVQLSLDGRWARTDPSGWFMFRDLPGGAYTLLLVLETLPLRYLPLLPLRQQVEVREGEGVTLDVPTTMRRLLTGRIFLDRNRNGAFDAGEPALRGMPVCLDGRRVAQSDARGVYQFADLAHGRHRLELNCGMPARDLLPLSSLRPVIRLRPEDPERIVVDFRLERREAIEQEVIRSREREAPPRGEGRGARGEGAPTSPASRLSPSALPNTTER